VLPAPALEIGAHRVDVLAARVFTPTHEAHPVANADVVHARSRRPAVPIDEWMDADQLAVQQRRDVAD
jgi:hypothetical protein